MSGANIATVDLSALTRGTALAATVGTTVDSGIGSQRNYGAVANAHYDFGTEGSFIPHVGRGIGVQNSKFGYRPSDIGHGSEANIAWLSDPPRRVALLPNPVR